MLVFENMFLKTNKCRGEDICSGPKCMARRSGKN